eukprot:TRINITY_DN12879_c0_g1_i1.p1 TRINITY_DN12879_c0_g1~~TRINITY_DN12879_c0_g1_i1.p1  ORF type:complete len:763 (-),score=249.83 TRINITY_DN12879_c0_g1_i1:72-2360(-)
MEVPNVVPDAPHKPDFEVCICGTPFELETPFCRKCGASKPQVSDSEHSLVKLAEVLGWTLTLAIREFRFKVEEVFDEHSEAMERVESRHKMEVSMLRAENMQLRDMLNSGESPGMFQNVHFEAKPRKEGKKKPKGAEESLWAEIKGIKGRMMSGKDPKDEVTQLKPRPGGGQWESFLAWVPSGAALQCPQPWRPLPCEAFHAPDLIAGEPEEEEDEEAQQFKVLEVWAASREELQRLRTTLQAEHTDAVVPTGGAAAGTKAKMRQTVALARANSSIDKVAKKTKKLELLNPQSGPRVSWDICSLLLVVFDMVAIPLAVFPLGESSFLAAMDWVTRLFWTLDMPMSICTGVTLPNGTVVKDFKFVVAKYMKTWLMLDMFIVGSDWMEFFLGLSGDSDESGGIGRVARTFRIVRAARLLRLVRMKEVLSAITERVQSEQLSFILSFLKLMAALVMTAHIMCCLWWWVGTQGDTKSASWSKMYGFDSKAVEAQYLMALHWTLSQFSGGMEEVRPISTAERLFVILFWIAAFFMAALVASVLTSSLVQLHIIGGSQSRQLATLRKYLNQNAISSNLAVRVQRSAKHAVSGDLAPDAVDLLTVVSEQLQLEMHFEMYSELLRIHTFFEACIKEGVQVMRRICHFATSTVLLDKGDVVFSKGEAPGEPKMYFMFRGTAEYVHPQQTVTIEQRQWVGEPVLWTKWSHRGTLTTTSDCKLAKLDARKFMDIMDRFKELFQERFSPKVYAADYVEQLNKAEAATDLLSIVG